VGVALVVAVSCLVVLWLSGRVFRAALVEVASAVSGSVEVAARAVSDAITPPSSSPVDVGALVRELEGGWREPEPDWSEAFLPDFDDGNTVNGVRIRHPGEGIPGVEPDLVGELYDRDVG